MKKNKIALAFFGLCFSWMFSWVCLKYQAQSHVSIYTSLGYRMITAGVICFLISKKLGYNLKIQPRYLKYILICGIFNASANFAMGYKAVQYIPSGMIAAISSLSIILNEIFNSAIEKKPISKKTVKSGLIGTVGLFLFIYPTLKFSGDFYGSLKGFAIAIIMATVVCPGYYSMKKCVSESKIEILVFISYVFITGGTISLIFSILTGGKLNFDFSINYISSIFYLIIFASCVAYLCLYYLIKEIGAAKANYSSLVYTVGAIFVSTIFEDYVWHYINFFGFAMVLFSIYMQFSKKQESI